MKRHLIIGTLDTRVKPWGHQGGISTLTTTKQIMQSYRHFTLNLICYGSSGVGAVMENSLPKWELKKEKGAALFGERFALHLDIFCAFVVSL